MMNPVVHFEMPYRDAERASAFYHQAFGWSLQLLGPEMGHYLLATTATIDSRSDQPRGAINGGLYPFKPDWPMQYPSVVIAVEDMKAAMGRISTAGGKVLGEPMSIPNVGDFVSFIDSEGNRTSIFKPLMT